MTMAGSLAHLRVLDLSRVLAGPWCGQLLADLGAQVIKVERPGEGDDTRRWGPPFLKDRNGQTTTESAYFMSANRGKQSITVDVSSTAGQTIIRELALRADVLIENYKVGGLQKYGLDYHSLSSINPRLIYCSITGFGQDGPYAALPGYDLLVQGMGGLMSITGEADGEPTKTGVAIADLFTGMYATVAILSALAYRERTGEGQHIDLGLLDVTVAMMSYQANNYLVGDTIAKRRGNAHPSIVPYQVFTSADGHMLIVAGNDKQFQALCRAISLAELTHDNRFVTNADRVRNRDELLPILQNALHAKPTRDWVEVLSSVGVPAGPINTVDQVFRDPQVLYRQMVVGMPHPMAENVRLVGNPIRMSRTPVQYDRPPPLLGLDTNGVLSELLGLSAERIETLRTHGVI
jgi:crotonobetainyl-CoA:carnitine CoA-transferase CaiB-like acyl-CoA transferase